MLRLIVLPMALLGIAATSLYVFIIAWNEYLFALLFLVQDRQRWTVMPGRLPARRDLPVLLAALLHRPARGRPRMAGIRAGPDPTSGGRIEALRTGPYGALRLSQ